MKQCTCDCGCQSTKSTNWYKGPICTACYMSEWRNDGKCIRDNPKQRKPNMTLEEVYEYYTHPSRYTLYFETGCWLSTVKTRPQGHPHITWNGRQYFLHRLILAHKIGRMLTKDEETSHLCHNGHLGCINPNHLEVNDNVGNIAYRDAAGRQSKKLSNTMVGIIRWGYSTGMVTMQQLAETANCSQQHISEIINGKQRGPNPFKEA